jgi:hypothetical protein
MCPVWSLMARPSSTSPQDEFSSDETFRNVHLFLDLAYFGWTYHNSASRKSTMISLYLVLSSRLGKVLHANLTMQAGGGVTVPDVVFGSQSVSRCPSLTLT